MAMVEVLLTDKQEVHDIWDLESCITREVSGGDKPNFGLVLVYFTHTTLTHASLLT